ncbi:MAG: hypothetical protein CBE26_04235 [Kiritimatiellaceae bacterium TMED266]|nr:MAG: hypothetical protein CBE26_04235 [Kiritimatiellaceae bacterium TMED266]
MNWLEKLERRIGNWAVPNLAIYLIGLQAIGVVLLMTERTSSDQLFLHGSSVLHRGEWWRLISFMMLPETLSPLFLFFAFYVFFMISNSLEEHWGTFKYNMFVWVGYLLTVISAFINPGMIVTNTYFLGAVFLAFATIFPHVTFRLFLIIPVKVKWLGWLTAVGYLLTLLNPSAGAIAAGQRWGVITAFITYLLFFGGDLIAGVRAKQRKQVFTEDFEKVQTLTRHTCATCGSTEKSRPELGFRYCSVCGGCYCVDHIGEHQEKEHAHGN